MRSCAICRRVGRWVWHHPTGTDAVGRHLDPDLVIALCHDHHTLVHDDWNTLGIQVTDGC